MNEAVRKLFDEGLSDSRIRSVSWRDDDLVVELALPPGHAEEPSFFLRGRNATNVKIDLDFGSYVGSPLLFEAKAEPIGTTGWLIRFEFGGAPDGEISFWCSDVVLEESREK